IDAARDVTAGAVNNRSRKAAFVCNRGQYISPNRAVETTGVVHHDYIARWNIIDVIPDCSFVDSAGYIFQSERPTRGLIARGDGLNAQALPVNCQTVQGIRHHRDRELLEFLDGSIHLSPPILSLVQHLLVAESFQHLEN